MNNFQQTDSFSNWLYKLKDIKAKARIFARLRNAEYGNFGDYGPVGEGISEMRIHFGPGYRLYFCQQGKEFYWLLAGGDKSTQKSDIKQAKSLRREIEEMNHGEGQ